MKDTNGQNRAKRMTHWLGEVGWGVHYEKESGAVETR
jgi:hypothetical protein